MPVYCVVSETLYKKIPITDDGDGPLEPYRICELVIARSREQARYLAWETDKSFDRYIRNMPNFRTRKLRSTPDCGEVGIVSEWTSYRRFWALPQVNELLSFKDF